MSQGDTPPLRVAFFLTVFPSLSETFILNQIIGLLDLGVEVDIFADGPPRGESAVHPYVAAYKLLERTRYVVEGAGSSAAHRLLRGLARQRSVVWRVMRDRSLDWRERGRHILLAEALRGRRYDALHAHFGPVGLRLARLREAGVPETTPPLLCTFYGFDVTRYPRQHGEDVYRPLFQQADRILALSEEMAANLRTIPGAPADHIALHHLGIDCARFPFRPRTAPPPGQPARLLSVARLVEKKGIDDALRALALLPEDAPPWTYRVIGDGPLRGELESLARNLNVADRVAFLGSKPAPEVLAEMEQAHLFVAPSRTASDGDREGTPTVLVEAQACGLPVLATRHAGIPEMIRDGESGFLVPEGAPEALAERLAWLLAHPERWADLGASGREVAEAEFDARKLNQGLARLYKDLSRPGRSRRL